MDYGRTCTRGTGRGLSMRIGGVIWVDRSLREDAIKFSAWGEMSLKGDGSWKWGWEGASNVNELS